MLDIRPIGIEDYAERHSKPLSALHNKLWMETYSKTREPGMMVGALEATFLKMLVTLTNARRILEIGTQSRISKQRRCSHSYGSEPV